jgi:hypothetical protein
MRESELTFLIGHLSLFPSAFESKNDAGFYYNRAVRVGDDARNLEGSLRETCAGKECRQPYAAKEARPEIFSMDGFDHFTPPNRYNRLDALAACRSSEFGDIRDALYQQSRKANLRKSA